LKIVVLSVDKMQYLDGSIAHGRANLSVSLPNKGHFVNAFDKSFDDHFEVNSDLVGEALHGRGSDQCSAFPEMKSRPACWGLQVRFIWKLWTYIQDDLKGYVAAHAMDPQHNHVCLVEPCLWHHAGVKPVRSEDVQGKLQPMRADMHLVVKRYVEPWTEGHAVGLALILNAGHIAWSPKNAVDCCKAQVFISHCWNEAFEEFANTLHQTLNPDTVVWVCSFALCQHSDIAQALESVERCPFALAMHAAERVLLVMDSTAEAIERCWVVLEAALAEKWQKDYDMCLPDDGNQELWRMVGSKIANIDVDNCKASYAEDKEKVLAYARAMDGGIDTLNSKVHKVGHHAMERAEIMAASMAGDIDWLSQFSTAQLLSWRSIRGRTAAHIAAERSRVKAMVTILNMTANAHLNAEDDDSRSPLSVATEYGSLASVLALISLRADPEQRSNTGLTPLHFAASAKLRASPMIVSFLIEARADVEVQGTYQGRKGHRPITVAAVEGNGEVIRALVSFKAELNATTGTGASALHVAAWFGNADAATALLVARAEPDLTTGGHSKKTPLSLANLNGHAALAILLIGSGAKPMDGENGGPFPPALSPLGQTAQKKKSQRSRAQASTEAALFSTRMTERTTIKEAWGERSLRNTAMGEDGSEQSPHARCTALKMCCEIL